MKLPALPRGASFNSLRRAELAEAGTMLHRERLDFETLRQIDFNRLGTGCLISKSALELSREPMKPGSEPTDVFHTFR